MFCTNCGKKLKDGAHFCAECGSPVSAAVGESSSVYSDEMQNHDLEKEPVRAQVSSATESFVQQIDSGKPRDRKKMSPHVLIVLALAAVTATAIISYQIYSASITSGNQPQLVSSESSLFVSSEDAISNSASASGDFSSSEHSSSQIAQSQQATHPARSAQRASYHYEEGAISADFPEDWAPPVLEWSSRGHTSGFWVSEGVFNKHMVLTEVAFETMSNLSNVNGETTWEREPSGGRFSGAAWTLESNGDSVVFSVGNTPFHLWMLNHEPADKSTYLASYGLSREEQEQLLHLSVGDKLSLDDVLAMSKEDVEKKGLEAVVEYMEGDVVPYIALGKKNASKSDGASGQKAESFDQAKAEQEARAQAEAAGMTILTGVVEIVDDATRQAEIGRPNMNPTNIVNATNAVLLLDSPTAVEGVSSDAGHPSVVHDIESVLLVRNIEYTSSGVQYIDSKLDPWRKYEGQVITVACSDIHFATDTSYLLYNACPTVVEVIAPLTEEDMVARQAAAESGAGDYVLADSNARTYSRSELEVLDNLELYHARNEIFARHGRLFKNTDLQDYFNGKSWYNGTIAPESFSESVLNDYERANADLMLEIEQSRNSPYLQ